MSVKYLGPNHNPPTLEDYKELMAQFMWMIMATGKDSVSVPHELNHPLSKKTVYVTKQVDDHRTIYTVVADLQ